MTLVFHRTLPALAFALFLASCGEKPDAPADAQADPAPPEAPAQVILTAPPGEDTPSEEGDIIIEAAKPKESDEPEMTADQRKEVIDEIMQARARQQAQGLGRGQVTVNGAWNYRGYSYLTPDPNAAIKARLVAVDITISGHTPYFDFDDIEIVDGVSMISYGSDPHPEFLTLDGELMPADESPAGAPAPSRWLLIYAFPEATDTFHLYYWGQQLTPSPVEIADSGMELPYPPADSNQ